MTAIYGKLPKTLSDLTKENSQPNLDRLSEEIYSQEKFGENDIVKKPSIRDRAKMFEPKGPKVRKQLHF